MDALSPDAEMTATRCECGNLVVIVYDEGRTSVWDPGYPPVLHEHVWWSKG